MPGINGGERVNDMFPDEIASEKKYDVNSSDDNKPVDNMVISPEISDETLKLIADGNPAYVIQYLKKTTIFDVPRIELQFEIARRAAKKELINRAV